MSGSEDPETVAKSFRVGAEDFLQKPIKEEILNRRIKKCLEMKERKQRTKFLEVIIEEEKDRSETLKKKLEEMTSIKKRISEQIETPLMVVMNTIGDLMKGKYEKDEYKLALLTILKTLGSSDLYRPAFVDAIRKQQMDEKTKEWLTSQFTNEFQITDTRKASVSRTRTTKATSKTKDEKLPFDLDSLKVPEKFTSFEFDTLQYPEEELKKFVLVMFRDSGIFKELSVSPVKMWNLLAKVQAGYRNNPYHNFFHALDVTQFAYAIILEPKIADLLTTFDKFTLLVAALFHDISHPGLTNTFLVLDHSELAYTYNGIKFK